MITGVDEQVCPACRGTGTGETYDDHGRRDPCDHCDGSGRVVPCLECGGDVAAPLAESDGCFCRSCTRALDIGMAEAEAMRLLRVG